MCFVQKIAIGEIQEGSCVKNMLENRKEIHGKNCTTHDLWGSRYRPITRSHLTVPAKKILEIENALQTHNVVVVQGPTGSGKTSAVYVIAYELGYPVSEWNPPSYCTNDSSFSYLFFKFLSTRLTPLALCAEETIGENKERYSFSKKDFPRYLRIIKDIPFTLYDEENTSCYSLIKKTKRLLLKCASKKETRSMVLIFILGDRSMEAHWFRLIFSNLERCSRFIRIRIKHPTVTALKRVWHHIASSEDHSVKKQKCATSNLNMDFYTGDLNLNQFLLHLQFSPTSFQTLKTPFMKSMPQMEKSLHHEMMHTIARILWNKRLDTSREVMYLKPLTPLDRVNFQTRPAYVEKEVSLSKCSNKQNSPKQLSYNKLYPKLLRPPLYYNLDSILDALQPHLKTIVDLLHENYIYFFGEIADAADFLCQLASADGLIYPFDETKEIVCIKSVLDSNLHPISPYHHSSIQLPNCVTQSICALRLRKVYSTQACHERLLTQISRNEQTFCLKPHDRAFYTDIVPCLRQMINSGTLCDAHHNEKKASDEPISSIFSNNQENSDLFELSENDLEPEDEIENLDF